MNSSDRPLPPLLLPPVSPHTPPPLLPLPPFPSPLFSAPLHHTPPPTKPLAGAAKQQGKTKSELAGLPKSAQTCTECGRCFSSWKALFGHMRCHPERQWRGIKPPPPQPPPHSQIFTDEEHQVAATLVLLANGPPPAAAEFDPGAIIRSLSSSLKGSMWRRRREAGRIIKRRLETAGRSFSSHPYASSSSSSYRRCQSGCLLDLNMAPPLETAEGERNLILDLKLGF